MGLCEKDCCKNCSRLKICGGCEKCGGHPNGGSCFVYSIIKESGYNEFIKIKNKLIEEINNLNIDNLKINDLNLLLGYFINLEYSLENGSKIKLLNDNDVYLGNQVEIPNDDRCYGISTNGKILVISRYGCNGSNPELILYKNLNN